MGLVPWRLVLPCSWCLWKALDEKGCMGLVPWCLVFGLAMQKFLNIE
jgi:hypothetical protein